MKTLIIFLSWIQIILGCTPADPHLSEFSSKSSAADTKSETKFSPFDEIKKYNPEISWIAEKDISREVQQLTSKNDRLSTQQVSTDFNQDGIPDYGVLAQDKKSYLLFAVYSNGDKKWKVQLLRKIDKSNSNDFPYHGYLTLKEAHESKKESSTSPNKKSIVLEHYYGSSMAYSFDFPSGKFIEESQNL